MSTALNAALVDALRQHRLLEAKQLEELPSLQTRFPDPKSLARELLQRGWLTAYQANQLLQGKGQELVLGSYLLLERLGEGGMGQVFKARHRNLGRIAAVKVIHKQRLDKPDAIRRFQREVQAAAALSHPNIVLAYDADQIGDTHLLVMECIDGATDLAKLVTRNGPLPVASACEYIRQAALGLQHAHERGMVHRDIKPANLLLTAGGLVVKILDMGLARLDATGADSDSSGTMTQQGAVMGTPDYMAPEQTRESHTVDIRADLYSLGCTFYFLLTGQVPFPGGSLTEKLLKHRREEPRPVEQLRPAVPPEVAAVVRKLMAKKPEDRYQTPAEVATALAAAGNRSGAPSLEGIAGDPTAVVEGSSDRVDGAPKDLVPQDDTLALAAPDRPRRKGKQRVWLPFAVAGGSFVLVAAALLLFWLSHQPVVNKLRMGVTSTSATLPPPTKGQGANLTVEEPKPKGAPANPSAALLEGQWYYLGPFDNPRGMKGFDTVYPPEEAIDLKATYQGKNNQPIQWQEYPGFQTGIALDFLPLFAKRAQKELACIYLYHEIDVAEATTLPISLGSDDTLTVWLNEERLLNLKVHGAVEADSYFTTLKLKAGKNRLLVKVCQDAGAWGFYIAPVMESELPFYVKPGFDIWTREVAALAAAQQVEAVAKKLQELNPGFDGKVTHKLSADGVVVTDFHFQNNNVKDLSPVRALVGLKKLSCRGLSWNVKGSITDLSPLAGMKLTWLACDCNRVRDLSPLKGMKLTYLSCPNNFVSDLSPLPGMDLTRLTCRGTRVSDLSPLKDMKLTNLSCAYTAVSDLSPLKDMSSLTTLDCAHTPVSDLSALMDMKLTYLSCGSTKVTDLSPLKALPLKVLKCDFRPERDAVILRSIKTLETINAKAARDIWKEVDEKTLEKTR